MAVPPTRLRDGMKKRLQVALQAFGITATGEPARYYLNILTVCSTVWMMPYASGMPTISQEMTS